MWAAHLELLHWPIRISNDRKGITISEAEKGVLRTIFTSERGEVKGSLIKVYEVDTTTVILLFSLVYGVIISWKIKYSV